MQTTKMSTSKRIVVALLALHSYSAVTRIDGFVIDRNAPSLITRNEHGNHAQSYPRSHHPTSRWMASKEIGVGIDLGTTNSAIAFLKDDDVPTIIDVPNNGRTMKSIVTFAKGDASGGGGAQILVGNDAVEAEQQSGKIGYHHVKRVIGMGSQYLSPELMKVVPHLLIEDTRKKKKSSKHKKAPSLQKQLDDGRNNPIMLRSIMGGNDDDDEDEDGDNTVSPIAISSQILIKLLDVAKQSTNMEITRAVIGVPAYFNDAQREATTQAANMAGIDKVKLLREPEAAALAYGVDKDLDEEELVLVFDLGGGTYDVSMLLVGEGLTEVVCTAGDSQLGGVNFDAKIYQFLKTTSRTPTTSGTTMGILSAAAEHIRIYLSNNRAANLALPRTEEGWSTAMDSNTIIVEDAKFDPEYKNATHVHHRLTRRQMELLCADELQGLLTPIRQVAIMAGALLPGDTRPSLVESAMEMEEAMREEEEEMIAATSEGEDAEALALLEQTDQMKAIKKAQQKGRKKARNVSKQERQYRAEAQRAASVAKSDVKVREDGISGRPISRVVLVGGASRMPVISRLIAALTGVVPQRTVDPDEAVALGCAVHVGVLDGKEGMGTVLNPMQAAILRAMVEKQQREGAPGGMFDDDFDDGF